MLTLKLCRRLGLIILVALSLLFSTVLKDPAAFAQVAIAQPGTEGLDVIVNSTNPVIATYQGHSATYSDDLYLVVDDNPAHDKFLFNNHMSPVGSTTNLGSFSIGTKLVFRLHVRDTGKDYFTGPPNLNPDRQPHARAQANWKSSETLVSFEDLLNGPFNYNDLSFSFIPTTAGNSPGWYRVRGSSAIRDDKTTGLKIIWENSYIYQHPGADNLYWYAEIVYRNAGTKEVPITCAGRTDPSLIREWMRGTEGLAPNTSAYVAADETFCSRNPSFTRPLKPGEHYVEWAVFHNVPPSGEVRIEWGSDGFSPWTKPWYSPFIAPQPSVCPLELVNLKTCQLPPDICPVPSQIYENTKIQSSGLVGATTPKTSSELRIENNRVVGNITINNYMRFWLEIVSIQTSSSADINQKAINFNANTTAGLMGLYAKFRLLPPCASNVITGLISSCPNPGQAAWIASFCSKGEITLKMGQTSRAVDLTLLNAIVGELFSFPLLNLETILSVLTDLETNVPSFAEAGQCFSPLTTASYNCLSQSLSQLAGNNNQLTKMLQVLWGAGVNLALDELAHRILHTDLTAKVADEATYVQRTTEVGTYPFAHIGISGE